MQPCLMACTNPTATILAHFTTSLTAPTMRTSVRGETCWYVPSSDMCLHFPNRQFACFPQLRQGGSVIATCALAFASHSIFLACARSTTTRTSASHVPSCSCILASERQFEPNRSLLLGSIQCNTATQQYFMANSARKFLARNQCASHVTAASAVLRNKVSATRPIELTFLP